MHCFQHPTWQSHCRCSTLLRCDVLKQSQITWSRLGAGVRKHPGVINKRLKQFKRRLSRFWGLRKAGIDTARILRTGGVAGLTYRKFVYGVTPSLLLAQRRAVASAAAPASGSGGQNLDLALMLADGSPSGAVDPAFHAHAQPIGHWAQAVWNKWMPRRYLLRPAAAAKRRLSGPPNLGGWSMDLAQLSFARL